MLKIATVAACLLAALTSAADAAFIDSYNDQRSFLAAIQNPGQDALNDLPPDVAQASALQRNAGAYRYTASSSIGLYALRGEYLANGLRVSSGFGTALSTNGHAPLVLDGFAPNVYAIGMQLYAADAAYAGGPIRMRLTDRSGATLLITEDNLHNGGDSPNYIGIITDSPIVSASLWVPDGAHTFPTFDNLALGTISAVPEPENAAMLLLGAMVLGLRLRATTARCGHEGSETTKPALGGLC